LKVSLGIDPTAKRQFIETDLGRGAWTMVLLVRFLEQRECSLIVPPASQLYASANQLVFIVGSAATAAWICPSTRIDNATTRKPPRILTSSYLRN
jgi:hypothetical protein